MFRILFYHLHLLRCHKDCVKNIYVLNYEINILAIIISVKTVYSTLILAFPLLHKNHTEVLIDTGVNNGEKYIVLISFLSSALVPLNLYFEGKNLKTGS